MTRICALCEEREANKNNTHYLSDNIIRTALNQEGSNEREKGFYFDFPINPEGISFNFQRKTTPEKLQKVLGRETTDEENENAKKIPFSVDKVFCSECESKFTVLENEFTMHILPLFRGKNLTEIDELNLEQVRTIRLFFLLQIWRSAICDEKFIISDLTKEKLREIIFNHETISDADINAFPLSITYFETLGDNIEYTLNMVECQEGDKPSVILMNDFIIQFYERDEDIRFESLHGINNPENYQHYINIGNTDFRIKIIHDKERRQIIESVHKEKAEFFLKYSNEVFSNVWYYHFRTLPSISDRVEFYQLITSGSEKYPLKYTKNHLFEVIDFMVRERII